MSSRVERIEKPRPRGSLRTRWTLSVLAVGAVPLAAFGFVSLRVQRSGLETSERTHEVAVIDHVSDAIANVLGGAAAGTVRAGQLLTHGSVGDVDARIVLAREAVGAVPALDRVALYSNEGGLVDSIEVERPGPSRAPPPERLPSSVSLSADAPARWLPLRWEGQVPVISYLAPIRVGDRVQLWAVGTLRVRVFDSIVRDISRDRFENRGDGVLLLDRESRIIASGARGGALATGASIRGTDVSAAARLVPALFMQALAVSVEFRDASGADMVGSVRVLPDMGWAVAVRRPAAAVFGALRVSRRVLFGGGVGLALLAVMAGIVVSQRTIRPVRQLDELAKSYGRREFDRVSPVRTGDELEALGDTLETMANDISASEREVARRAAVEASLSRYLPVSVAQEIAAGDRSVALGGNRVEITVLFADVASFTPFAESTTPETAVEFLNELFGVLAEVVFRHDGTIDKYVGDAIMAIFGAPTPHADHAARALAAAEDMHRFVAASAPSWKEKYNFDVALGIGVNSGAAIVGNLGTDTRIEYTAIGDVVNVAARLEGLARGGQTLATSSVVKMAGDGFEYQPLGEHPIRGRAQSVEVVEVR